jgi:chemotaxis protein histidine kinase CheA
LETAAVHAVKTRSGTKSAAFDAAHLRRYTLDNAELERELLGLFCTQLPLLLEQVAQASCEAEWRSAAHTLKGSARTIGAPALAELAVALETMRYPPRLAARRDAVRLLGAAARAFRKEAGKLYPGL